MFPYKHRKRTTNENLTQSETQGKLRLASRFRLGTRGPSEWQLPAETGTPTPLSVAHQHICYARTLGARQPRDYQCLRMQQRLLRLQWRPVSSTVITGAPWLAAFPSNCVDWGATADKDNGSGERTSPAGSA